eukprot:CAMPEP_0116872364 /NCGR_PEP_ID=MMETSP0463-20121206/3106_1 /TAXON_ID=181622 /ORGANISM="Strombidinopsis sp, Strain SopsisLIS2011" /LENGTH=112 /DNA_ID=CAMNT_0004512495 /DNA_START=1388 /DNA_END=1726 /DNA_ORIENTATION=-
MVGNLARSTHTKEMQDYINKELKTQESKFSSEENLKVFVGSFNIAGVKPYDSVDLSPWLFPFKMQNSPDIYVLGLQEIMELKAKAFVGKGSNRVDLWNKLITDSLTKNDQAS